MPPEDYIGLEQEEYHRRVDAVVEEMKALNISSIVIVQDSVVINAGNPATSEPTFYEPITCSNHETHPEHIWIHPEFGEVECLGVMGK